MKRYNTWDYKIGDLILVKRRQHPSHKNFSEEYGVVIAYHENGLKDGFVKKKKWEYVSSSSGKRDQFWEYDDRVEICGDAKETKVKLLARGTRPRED